MKDSLNVVPILKIIIGDVLENIRNVHHAKCSNKKTANYKCF